MNAPLRVPTSTRTPLMPSSFRLVRVRARVGLLAAANSSVSAAPRIVCSSLRTVLLSAYDEWHSRISTGPGFVTLGDWSARKDQRWRICVTGASGKAGRATVADLLEHGHDVRATDVAPAPADLGSSCCGRI